MCTKLHAVIEANTKLHAVNEANVTADNAYHSAKSQDTVKEVDGH